MVSMFTFQIPTMMAFVPDLNVQMFTVHPLLSLNVYPFSPGLSLAGGLAQRMILGRLDACPCSCGPSRATDYDACADASLVTVTSASCPVLSTLTSSCVPGTVSVCGDGVPSIWTLTFVFCPATLT